MARTSLTFGLGLMVLLTAACGQAPGMMSPAVERTSPVQALATFGTAPSDYYRDAAGQKGQALVRSLKDIVAKHKDLGYNRARDAMFAEVDDLDDNNVVECDYTGRALANVTGRASAYLNGKGLNAEHTWPQSKGAVGPAKSDLHHLFPTDVNANSKRGSHPFGKVAQVQWTEGGSKLGLDAKGRRVFEPRDDQKGNTARALFYFYTVYGDRADLENFQKEHETLLRWHKEDPVNQLERQRNDAVYRYQGNRNPFVDRPEFVDAVGHFLNAGFQAPAFVTR